MERYRAIPQGYMTAGAVAKKMSVTVRTLQHYDKEGLLSPSAMSEGGRRLYTDKDIIKHFDSETLDHIRNRFDKESGIVFMLRFLHLQDEAIQLHADGIPAESQRGQQFAKDYWVLIMEFTGRNTDLLPKLIQMGQSDEFGQEWTQKHAKANAFIEPALGAYFSNEGIDPFQEAMP